MNIEAHHTDGLEACVVECWSCKGPASPRALFCSVCGAVQPPRPMDHFQRLGLMPGFDVDQGELERHYFGFQRRLHPDRFAARSAKEKLMSQQQAMALNEAYETLKEPLKRAAYLLKLKGRKADAEDSAKPADPALLMEQMEAREALMEADSAEQVQAILARTESDIAFAVDDLSQAFAAECLEGAAKLVMRLKYLMRLSDEARGRKSRMTRGTL
ncbi:MAG: Fe-S protein assembly co-chaperone HscB [Alphaproteobacteria bacterium]|nr:Fe-S protein assembly co-chaperone HscB [Alphaproteobacteria bacterium]